MHYVYILKSINAPEQIYTGCTKDLKQRLLDHNSGKSKHTKKYKPWRIVTYVALDDAQRAKDFEAYLKSGSGRAFMKRRLL